MPKRSRRSDSDTGVQNYLAFAVVITVIVFGVLWLNKNSTSPSPGNDMPQTVTPATSANTIPLGSSNITSPGDIQGSKPATPPPTQIQGNSQSNPQNTLKINPDQLDNLRFTQ
jgi:hypothetical protein